MPNKSRGLAAPEMVIVVPIFLLLMFGVFELSRAIQANNIVVNMSREGANLASRSTKETPQEIMGALAMTTDPLKMDDYGLIYITVVVGKEGASPFVLEQHMWTGSGYAEPSRVWAGCTSWTGGACNVPNQAPPAVVPLALNDGETVYAVEVFYDYQNVTSYVISDGPVLYSLALL